MSLPSAILVTKRVSCSLNIVSRSGGAKAETGPQVEYLGVQETLKVAAVSCYPGCDSVQQHQQCYRPSSHHWESLPCLANADRNYQGTYDHTRFHQPFVNPD